jgi:peptidoglycan/LPS O-acetylase OafA/YrhL
VNHLLVVHDMVGDDDTINHSLWSIAVEWRIYFFFPLLVMLWRKTGPVGTTLLAAVAGVVLFGACLFGFGASLTAHYLGLFAFGMLGAETAFGTTAMSAKLKRAPWGAMAIVCFALAAAVLKHPLPGREEVSTIVKDLLVGIAATGVMVRMSLNPAGMGSRVLSTRSLSFMGTFAYSIYLVHAPLLQVFWNATHGWFAGKSPLLELGLTYAVGVPLIVAVAYGFFLVCERPFLFSKKRALPLVVCEKQAD